MRENNTIKTKTTMKPVKTKMDRHVLKASQKNLSSVKTENVPAFVQT